MHSNREWIVSSIYFFSLLPLTLPRINVVIHVNADRNDSQVLQIRLLFLRCGITAHSNARWSV